MTNPKKILIVEDDEYIAKALSIRCRASGYEVEVAKDAVLAMTEAQRQSPDLIVLDISIPGGNGFQVVEQLQQETSTKDIPVIFVTASKRFGLRTRALELGAAGFLEKPYDAAELLDLVRDITSKS